MDKAIKILKQEIDWHRKHTGIGRIGGKTDDWMDGFIKGCEHCLAVLTNATRTDGEGQCDCPVQGLTVFHKPGCINYE